MSSISYEHHAILNNLRRHWMIIVLIWGSVLALGWWLLHQVWPYAGRWAAVAAVFLAYGLWVVGRGLPHNHRPGESRLLPTLGPGNYLTILRGLAIGLVAGFLFSPWPSGAYAWLPMLLYTFADIADYLDGYLARIANHATALGEELDMVFDGLGMLVVTLLAVWYGQLPWWYLSLGLARYLFILGLWWRQRQGKPVYEIPYSAHRRLFAGFQMAFMSAVLWPIVPPAGATIAGTMFAIPTALGFGRDWLVASGRLDPHSLVYRRVQRWLYIVTTHWLPPLLRVALAVTMAAIFLALANVLRPPAWVALFTGWQLPWPSFVAAVSGVMAIGATITAVLGFMGRLSAFLLVFPIGFDMVTRGLHWSNGIALTVVVCLMLLGTGIFSLWQPGERFLLQRSGEA